MTGGPGGVALNMKIEIWSDIVCPWCAIGKARLDAALAEFEHAEDVEIVWRSFELDVDAPKVRPGDYSAMLSRKYEISQADATEMVRRMTAAAAESGVEFNLDIARPGNSFDAHRVVHLGAEKGIQHAVKERFLRGYLREGEAISDHETIVRLAVEAGLDAEEVRGVLDSDTYAEAVRADEREARELGVGGVPLFVIDRRYALPGAQPAETILQALRQVWEEHHSVITVAADGPVCGPDGCAS